jgi:hypothetical protein
MFGVRAVRRRRCVHGRQCLTDDRAHVDVLRRNSPSVGTSPELARAALCRPRLRHRSAHAHLPVEPCSSTFIPAHEQKPKVEDNPNPLIYFLNHVLN